MRVVLFDVDGTLLWTDGAGRRAIHRSLREVLGIERPERGFRFDGRTDPEIVRLLAEAAGKAHDAAAVAEVLSRYVELLEEELRRPDHVTTLYPGVPELLRALEQRDDCAIGLLTGNIVPGARRKLHAAGLEMERFRVGAFGSDHAERSALPAIAQRRMQEQLGVRVTGKEIVIIGDTPADVACGREVGARAIAVATGSYSVAELLAAGADAAFPDLSDTGAVLAAVFAP